MWRQQSEVELSARSGDDRSQQWEGILRNNEAPPSSTRCGHAGPETLQRGSPPWWVVGALVFDV